MFEYSTKCNSQVIAQYVSFCARIDFFSQENFMQRFTNDPDFYRKRKWVATFAQILRKRKRMNEYLSPGKALRRKMRKYELDFNVLVLLSVKHLTVYIWNLTDLTRLTIFSC